MAKRTVKNWRSLMYRKRLAYGIYEVEAELLAEVMAHGGHMVIDGFKVWREGAQLFWEALPPEAHGQQLAFPFMVENVRQDTPQQ